MEKKHPEIAEYQDQACICVKLFLESINDEGLSFENILDKFQIILSYNSNIRIKYSTAIMIGYEEEDVRPDGYECYSAYFLCPKEEADNPFLCLKIAGNDKIGDVFFDVNVEAFGLDPDIYDRRFQDK